VVGIELSETGLLAIQEKKGRRKREEEAEMKDGFGFSGSESAWKVFEKVDQ
jgi:hypothetical protein